MWETLALACILVVAAALRLWRLDSLPPGLHQDEAIYGILGYNVSQGDRGIFFGEREPLYMYLLAVGLSVFGYGPLALRLVSVGVNLATLLLVWGFARLAHGRASALLSALGFATVLWQVTLARDAFRAITLPLMEALAALLLWRALTRGGLLRWTAAGAAGGAALYTYTAARALPLALAVPVVLYACRAGWLRRNLAGLGAGAVAAAVVFAPLGLFFADNVGAFTGRAEQVAAVGAEAGTPVAQIGRVLGLFLVAGDANPRHNLPGEPMFMPLAGACFLLGLGVALRRWREPAYLWLPLWLLVGLVPTALAIEAPHYLRALVAVEPACLLFGVGAAAALGWLGRRSVVAAALAGVALAAVLTGYTGWRYFDVWASRPEVRTAFNADRDRVGRQLAASDLWLEGRDRADRTVVSADFWTDRATAAFHLWPWLPTEEQRLDTTRLASAWFDERRALLMPAGPFPKQWLARDVDSPAFRLLREVRAATLRDAQPVVASNGEPPQTLQLDSAPEWPALAGFQPAHTRFGDAATLAGWRLEDAGLRRLALWWRVERDTAGFTPFVHVVDATGRRLVALEGYTRDPVAPRPGETLVTVDDLVLPLGAPPGEYRVLAGWYRPADGTRLPVDGGGDTATVATFTTADVGRGPVLGAPRQIRLGPVAVLGVALPDGPVAPGNRAVMDVTWGWPPALPGQTEPARARFVVSVEANGMPAAAWSAESVCCLGGTRLDRVEVPIGPRAAAGPARVTARVEDAATGVELGRADLGTIEVPAVARRFEPLPYATPVGATFGDVATLAGATVDAGDARPGGRLAVELVWRAGAETATSYKVFVHLAGADGAVAAQSDSAPDGGARPTSGWLGGEWVADRHPIALPSDLPAGEYRLLAGLYDGATGERLRVDSAGEGGAAPVDHVDLGVVNVRR